MKLFFRYLQQYRRVVWALLGCALLYAAVFFFYGLPPGAVLYPTVLSAVLGSGAALRGFARFRQRHRALVELAQKPAALPGELPPPDRLLEADYQELVRSLCGKLEEQSSAWSTRFGDMMDYYTVWAHQIKTPIAAMHLLLEGEDSSLSRQLTAELGRVETYADMVLTYLRLDSSSTDYLFRAHELDALLRRSIKPLSAMFIGRRLRLELRPTHMTVVTDEKWFTFVLGQLLSNALKYTPPGGCVTISLQGPGTLCIADTGIGIAADELPRVFERGYTGTVGRSHRQATGLGLYLCRRICEGLSIPIRLESCPGEGTQVYLELEQYRLPGE